MLNENGKRNMKNIEVQETVKLEDDFEFYDGEIASQEATKKIGVELDGNKTRKDNRKRRNQSYKKDGHKPFKEPGTS